MQNILGCPADSGPVGSISKLVGTILLSSLFVVTAVIESFFAYDEYEKTLEIYGIPAAYVIGRLMIFFKFIVGFLLLMTSGRSFEVTRWSMVLFIVVTSLIFHNPIYDLKKTGDMLKNLAIIGGLVLI